MSDSLLIVGTGGHAKEVLDIAEAHWIEIAGFYDENPTADTFRGFPVFSTLDDAQFTHVVIAIGNCEDRARLSEKFRDRLCEPLVSPSATVSPSAQLAPGTMIMPGAVISADAQIGESSIVGQQSYIAHDCVIGAHAHIATGCMINGEVFVGEKTLVGTGVVTRQCLSIGSNVICGAGSTIVESVPDGVTVVGTPARVIS